MKKTTRSLLLAVVASALLLPISASQNEGVYERGSVQIRAVVLPDSSTGASTEPTTAQTSAPASTSDAATSSQTAASASSAAPTTEASSLSVAQSSTTKGGSSAASPTTQPVTSSAVATTDASGQVVTRYVQYTPTPSSPAPSYTNSSSSSSGDSGGLSTGSIIGLSVAGGIAAIAIILFFVWKFTRKRFSDFDDNEAIKWPELNAHNTDVHALPTNATGRAGFGPENDSDVNLTRPPSPGAYANSITASVPEAYGAGDPYAVPPLPHLNPNQPYRDEPGAYGQPAGYYDPYRGPVPNTFTDTMSDAHGAEAIPMTQMARMRSPAPPVVYDMQGRGSPAPQAAMGYPVDERSRTPTSVAVSAGRASPSINPGYGYGPQ